MKVNYLFFILALTFSISPAQAESEVEAFIWQQESRYIQAYRDADHTTIMALWHNNFLGWPSVESEPIRKQQGLNFLKRRYRLPRQWDFTIEPQSIQLTGDIAVTQYLLKTWPASISEPQHGKVSRIVHTWLKEAGQWRVLGGMSAPWSLRKKQ